MVRAPVSHTGGRRFESCTAHHFPAPLRNLPSDIPPSVRVFFGISAPSPYRSESCRWPDFVQEAYENSDTFWEPRDCGGRSRHGPETVSCDLGLAAVGPNGLIAFTCGAEAGLTTDVCTLDPVSGSVVDLTNDGAFDAFPDWSPDGTGITQISAIP